MASEIQSKENAPPKATDDSAAVPRKEPAAEADPSMEHEEEPAVDDNAQDDVHEESDDDNGDEDDQSREPFTFDQIIQAIKEAAVLAEETGDYITYSTLLDVHLSDVGQFDDEEKYIILETLYGVFNDSDKLIYHVGWDLPELLLKYVVTAYDFEGSLPGNKHLPLVMKLMEMLSERGNPKELFVKSAECISTLDVSLDWLDTDHSEVVLEKYADLMFYLCYELMMHSLRRIKTQYPSRFLATASSVLLSFVAHNLPELKLLTLTVVLRRLFTFARDFEMAPTDEPVSEQEQLTQMKLLQSFITWAMDLCFQRFSVKWSERIFYEMRANMSGKSKKDRDIVYEQETITSRLTECAERIAQLSYSFDLDSMDLFKELANKEIEPPAADGHSDRDELFRELSNDGIILLATEIKFETRENSKEVPFAQIVKLATKYLQRDDGSLAPLGVQDALCFWSLWSTREITESEVQAIDKDEFSTYVRLMFMISAVARDKDTRFVAYSLVAKLLGMQKPAVAFDFIEDTLENCPFQNVKEASVRILKSLCLASPPKPASNAKDYAMAIPSLETHSQLSLGRGSSADSNVDEVAQQVGSLSLKEAKEPRVALTPERIKVIQTSVDKLLDDISGGTGVSSNLLPVLLSWINFFTVIDAGPEYALSLVDRVEAFVPKSSEDLSLDAKQRKAILLLSIDSLKKKWGSSAAA